MSPAVRSSLSESNIFAPDDVRAAVAVKTITNKGIELVDGLVLPSACIFIGGRVFLWNVPPITTSWDAWNLDHFKIFEVVIPRPEILILGTGEKSLIPPPEIKKYLSSIGVQLDVMNTWNACSTYNLLVEEGRRVAAALLPLSHRQWDNAPSPSPLTLQQ
ncbi:NADH dehydrogenase 1 alpha subcomplex assembly factor 3 [Cantharellus anzutake]|uniref:NADH dehydrogenase 1 alpha subcomplex assembly factor 3 n=1 Tax=Cantharellus anzutake TaxID=1750568 RepID=UPI001903278F|nr:NADH dehydrogenase 1 alpha subcomplex assembly factor 3 [Cantharellus anzutake]KAF8338793.1 NADH dehydrogenase 1 alpha subcomplex assembly factor 3 [Cantharellus anzutake]